MMREFRKVNRRKVKRGFLFFLLLLLSVTCAACADSKDTTSSPTAVSDSSAEASGAARLEPEQGCYFGIVNGNVTQDTVRSYRDWLGFAPASYTVFIQFPMRQQDIDTLNGLSSAISWTGGIMAITLEPFDGLDAISENDCEDFAALCAGYEKLGLGVMVRFAHEMNGSWYPWCQKPALYKEKFQLLAQYVHENTQNTAMLWAPNSGGGYPFSGGTYEAESGTEDFTALDTDGNGILDMNDDMFTPYYPGDDAVDWVGMSVYHWGQCYPWFENELPEARSFSNLITGNYNGLNGDLSAVPDFYAMFCNDGVHDKPMAITETAAFYNTEQDGASELSIKQAWWRQVFHITGDTEDALDISMHFPMIKMINWFDIQKNETEAKGDLVDWRISGSSEIQEAFISDLQLSEKDTRYFLSAEDFSLQ